MDTNIAAWMIAGGPRLEAEQGAREREQLHALLEHQRTGARGPGLVERIRDLVRPVTPAEPACCPA